MVAEDPSQAKVPMCPSSIYTSTLSQPWLIQYNAVTTVTPPLIRTHRYVYQRGFYQYSPHRITQIRVLNSHVGLKEKLALSQEKPPALPLVAKDP